MPGGLAVTSEPGDTAWMLVEKLEHFTELS